MEQMDKMYESYTKLVNSVEILEEKVSVFFHRFESEEKLNELAAEMAKCKPLLAQHKMANFPERIAKIRVDYEELKITLARQQSQMLRMLEEIAKREAGLSVNGGAVFTSLPQASDAPSDEHTPVVQKKTAIMETPRMSVSQYGVSPFIHRKRPIQLQFLDFEVNISQEDFAKIPHYMKGRDNLDDLLAFLNTTFIPTFTEKYTLVHKHKDAVANLQDLEIWRMYKDQEDYFPGLHFITEGDIARRLDRLVDKKMQSKIQMLRHLGIIREVRKNKAVCYVWVKTS